MIRTVKQLEMRLIIFIMLSIVSFFVFPGDAISNDENINHNKELKREIKTLNLINGFYLSREQMKLLMEQASKAQELKDFFIKEYSSISESSTKVLERLKSELEKDKGEVSKDIAKSIHLTHIKVIKLRSDYEDKMSKVIEEVKRNLTDTQLYIIDKFKPCLVPPKGPLRIGQLGSDIGGVKQLERVRAMLSYKYSVKKYSIADKIIRRLSLYNSKGVEMDKDKIRSTILSTFDEVRNLSDIDFELRKKDIASKLRENIFPKRRRINIDAKIEKLLLSPITISILKNRIRDSEKDRTYCSRKEVVK